LQDFSPSLVVIDIACFIIIPMEEKMKRTHTLLSLVFILIVITALGAQNHNGGHGQPSHQGNTPDYNHNNNYNHNQNNQYNYQNQIREFRGYLVVGDRGNHSNASVGLHLNFSPNFTTNLYWKQVNNHRKEYGIVLQKPNGRKEYFSFDNRGDRLARQLLSQRWRNKRQLVVEVRGKLNPRTNTIEVVSLDRVTGNHVYAGHRPWNRG